MKKSRRWTDGRKRIKKIYKINLNINHVYYSQGRERAEPIRAAQTQTQSLQCHPDVFCLEPRLIALLFALEYRIWVDILTHKHNISLMGK